MRVVVLGGTVFVGRAVVEALVASGHDVVIVHRGVHEPADPDYPEVEHVHAERAALPALRCDAVVDCYTTTGADTAAVLAALPDVPTVVLSSCDVYPMLDAVRSGERAIADPIDEQTPVRATRYPYRGIYDGMDDYEKLDCEPQHLERGHVVLRLPFVTGPWDTQRRESWVLDPILGGTRELRIGRGDTVVSRLHVADVGTAVVAVLGAQSCSGEVLVLADSPSSTVREWAEAIVTASGVEVDLVTVPDDDVPASAWWSRSHTQHMEVSPAKAMRSLDWRPTPWREAVRTSVEWHLRHQHWTPSSGR